MIHETAKEVLQKGYICDNCLGRQFAQILSGMTNRERGHAIRTALALEYAIKPFPADKSNFSGFNFRKDSGKKAAEREKATAVTFKPLPPSDGKPESKKEKEQCRICLGFFDNLGKWAEEAVKKLKPLEYRTFLVSSSMSRILVRNEENLWEEIGIEYCEPMKSELNRELGKLVAERTVKEPDEKNPDVTIMLDLERNRLDVTVNPVFIYGKYQKLVRGIPQTKWEMYKETVEEIIAKPFMRESQGRNHSLHAAGREDIDVRCLDWRPFILEVESPIKRTFVLKRMEAEINRTKKVKVSQLRYSGRKEVARVKGLMPDKTYRALASFGKPVAESELKKLHRISAVKQQTPTRVAHRRADLTRTRRVKSISWRILPKNRIEFTIKAVAGLYVKELITGDNGRTKPSFSGILGVPVKTEELDVVKIHLPQKTAKNEFK